MKRRLLFFSMALIFCLGSQAFAAKGGGGKDGGGGSDDGSSVLYDLVRLPGWDGTRSKAAAVSNTALDGSTYVLGEWRTNSGNARTCLWRVNAAGEVAETVDLSPVLTLGADVNCLGMVAGYVLDGEQINARVAFADGSFIDLGMTSSAIALTDPDENNLVRVVGNEFIDVGDGYPHPSARQWNIDVGESQPSLDATIDLAALAPENFSVVDCNNFGVLVGRSHTLEPQASVHPIVAWWAAPNAVNFEFLPDLSPEAIDDAGTVVGDKEGPTQNVYEGIVVAPDGTVTNLTVVTGQEASGANDVAVVNGVTQVVGRTIYASYWSGYLWTNGEMFNLNRLVKAGKAHIGPAEGINSSGAICGGGRFSDRGVDVGQGYLLIPKTP